MRSRYSVGCEHPGVSEQRGKYVRIVCYEHPITGFLEIFMKNWIKI